MPEFPVVGTSGLANSLNQANAPGTLTTAQNIVIDPGGVVKPRPGFARDLSIVPQPENADRIFFFYDGTVIIPTSGDELYRDNAGGWTQIGSTTFPDPDADHRLRDMLADQSLYVSASTGVFRIDDPTTIPALIAAIEVSAKATAASDAEGIFWAKSASWKPIRPRPTGR